MRETRERSTKLRQSSGLRLLAHPRGYEQSLFICWRRPRGRKAALGKSNDGCRMLLSLQGRFKYISEEFCGLIGYEQKELIGKCIDDITAARTVRVSQHLGAVLHFGQFHSLWMFVAREGRGIVARCEWELLPDMSISIFCEPVSSGTALTTDVLGKKLR
jgi:PAS domain S-box-containing protein